jgi:alanine dehydrogenase
LVLLLTEGDVRRLLTMDQTLEMVEQAFRAQARGEVVLPPKVQMQVAGMKGAVRVLPSAIPELRAVGHKTISGAPGSRNPLETYFTILMFAADDGRLVSMMAGETITQLRTGAASGIATRYLARPGPAVLGILGTGLQGTGQALGIHAVMPLDSIAVFGPSESKAALFAEELSGSLHLDVTPMKTPEQVVEASDIIATATPSRTPIFAADSVKPGTHINAIGSNSPDKCEIDVGVFARSRVVVDHKGQALSEAGDLARAIREKRLDAADVTEIGDVIVGSAKGRTSSDEITLFKSVGVATEDVAVAAAVLKAALEKGLGTEIGLK